MAWYDEPVLMTRLLPGLLVLLLAIGCRTPPASVSLDTPAGIARLQRERQADGTERLALLHRGERLFFDGSSTRTLCTRGHPFVDVLLDPETGDVRAFMVHIRDAEGRVAYTLMDENADGEFDKKVDYQNQAVYEWQGGRWVAMKPQPPP